MTGRSRTERILDAYLAPEADRLPDLVIDAALDEIARTPQRRAIRVPWRFPTMPALSRATGIAAVALVAVVGAGGLIYLNSGGFLVGGPTASTSPMTPTVPPTAAPTVPPEIDTSSWNTFTSAVYGFTVGYPADWRLERRATRPWARGDGLDFSSPGVETFTSPEGDLAVSVWGVAVDPSPNPTTASSWEDFEAWIESFCTLTKNGPCTGIHDRVVPMCPDGDTECHTGAMIVPFTDNVAGFKGGDRGGITIVVDGAEVTYWVIVSVWQPESFPGLARYGGGTRLIQAFLESMGAQMPSRGPVDHSNHP